MYDEETLRDILTYVSKVHDSASAAIDAIDKHTDFTDVECRTSALRRSATIADLHTDAHRSASSSPGTVTIPEPTADAPTPPFHAQGD